MERRGTVFWEKQAGERTSRGWILYPQVLRADRQARLRYLPPASYHQTTRRAGPILSPYSWAPGQLISLFWISGSSLINSEIDWLRAIFLKIGLWEHQRSRWMRVSEAKPGAALPSVPKLLLAHPHAKGFEKSCRRGLSFVRSSSSATYTNLKGSFFN